MREIAQLDYSLHPAFDRKLFYLAEPLQIVENELNGKPSEVSVNLALAYSPDFL